MALPSAATPSGLVSKSIEDFIYDAFQGCDFFFGQLCESGIPENCLLELSFWTK